MARHRQVEQSHQQRTDTTQAIECRKARHGCKLPSARRPDRPSRYFWSTVYERGARSRRAHVRLRDLHAARQLQCLALEQAAVDAALALHQLLVRAFLDHLALLEDEQAV